MPHVAPQAGCELAGIKPFHGKAGGDSLNKAHAMADATNFISGDEDILRVLCQMKIQL